MRTLPFMRGFGFKRRDLAGLFVPVFFIAGYLLSFHAFRAQWAVYLLMTAAAGVSGFLAFRSLCRSEGNHAAAWLGFYVLLVFGYAKFYWLILDFSPVKDFFPEATGAWRHFEVPGTLLDAFLMQTLGFAFFCLSVWVFLHFKKTRKAFAPAAMRLSPAFLGSFLFSYSALLLVSIFLVHRYKVGLLGMPSNPLPFHISGAIFYLHTMVLPVAAVLFVSICEAAAEYAWSRTGLLLLILWAVSDALLRSSRASLMLPPLLFLFLALSGGVKARRYEVVGCLGLGFLAVALSPVIWSYRVCRLSGFGLFAALKSSISSFPSALSGILKSVSFVFFRIPGIESSVIVSGFEVQALGRRAFEVLFSEKGYAWYLGHSAFGLPYDAPNGYATPFIAQWSMAGGPAGVIAAGIVLAAFSLAAWDRLLARRSIATPAAGAVFLLLLFWALTEGVSHALFKQIFVFFAVFPILEFIVREYHRRFLTKDGE